MTKKITGLVSFSRSVGLFLEYPKPFHVDGTLVASGRVQSLVYFLLAIAGFLVILLMSIGNDENKSNQKKLM